MTPPSAHKRRDLVEAAGLSAALVFYSNGLTLWALRRGVAPEAWFKRTNLLVLALLCLYARLRLGGIQGAGLHAGDLAKSVGWGAAVGLGLSAPPLLFFYRPVLLDTPLEYGPVASMGPREVLSDIFVRLPVGVALLEELSFRGLLYGLLRRHCSAGVAIAGSAAAFAGWHLMVTATTAEQTNLSNARLPTFLRPYIQPLSTLGGMLSTGIAGALFGVVREHTGNLAGAIAAHWLVDSLMVAALWLRRPRRES